METTSVLEPLDAILCPQSVAVIGASTTPGKVGHDIFVNILKGGFTGTLYPVNPGARSIASVRAYPSVKDIPDQLDLAIVILPPKAALASVQDAIAHGVKGIVIVSAGFREVGREGLEIENRIVSLCREAGVRLVGPNCLGVINPLPDVSLNASFSERCPAAATSRSSPRAGRSAPRSSILPRTATSASRSSSPSATRRTSTSSTCSSTSTTTSTRRSSSSTSRSSGRGRNSSRRSRRSPPAHRPTPVLVIKSGRTSAGAQAAASHTGALAGTEAVYDAIFKQAGIIRVDSIAELFDFANAFAYKHESALGKTRRKIPGGQAGGHRDQRRRSRDPGDRHDRLLRPRTGDVQARRRSRRWPSHLPTTANIHNPVDVIGDAHLGPLREGPRRRDQGRGGGRRPGHPDPAVDDERPGRRPRRSSAWPARSPKPILCCFMGVVDVSAGVKYLQEHGYPGLQVSRGRGQGPGGALQVLPLAEPRASRPVHAEVRPRAGGQDHPGCLARREDPPGRDGRPRSLLKCYGFNTLPTNSPSPARRRQRSPPRSASRSS